MKASEFFGEQMASATFPERFRFWEVLISCVPVVLATFTSASVLQCHVFPAFPVGSGQEPVSRHVEELGRG